MTTALAIIGVIIIVFGVRWIVGHGSNALDRGIRRKTYQAGQKDVHNVVDISCPAGLPETLAMIINTVNPYDSAPAVVGGLYLKARNEVSATFGCGSKAGGDAFVARVTLRASGAATTGSLIVTAWRESGADVYGRGTMAALRERTALAIRNLGGTTNISIN